MNLTIQCPQCGFNQYKALNTETNKEKRKTTANSGFVQVGVSGKTQTLVIKLTLIITQRLGNQNPPPDTKPLLAVVFLFSLLFFGNLVFEDFMFVNKILFIVNK